MANEDMGYASSVSFKRWRAAGAARVDDNRRIAVRVDDNRRIAVRFKRVMAAGSARVDSRRIAAHVATHNTSGNFTARVLQCACSES